MSGYGANSQKKWICEYCTYINFPSSIKCTMCRNKRSSIAQDIYGFAPNINTTTHTWICDTCTFQNQENDIYCLQCDTPISNENDRAAKMLQDLLKPLHITECDNSQVEQIKKQGLSPTGNAKKWCCQNCTYENWPRAQKCAMCDRKQKSLISNQCEIELTAKNKKNSVRIRSDLEHKIKLQRRKVDSHWLNACIGVVNGDRSFIDIYLTHGGEVTRKLTESDVSILKQPSIFEVGQTLIHLAIRFNRENILSTLLMEIKGSGSGLKRVPSYIAPDLASEIRRYVSSRILQRSGDFPCYFLSEITTFALPEEIEALPISIQEKLLSELIDQDAQDQLETESPVINWSTNITERLGSRLNALWNRSTGDCLLDSVMQATYGVSDRDNNLRRALAESLFQAGHEFYPRWKEYETTQALLRQFVLDEAQFEQDWLNLLSLAGQPGSSLEQLHVFALAHILRRPIIVYGVKYFKSYRGETLDYVRFQGVYLPLIWEPSFCNRSPIALGYTRGHFSALVPFQPFSPRLGDSHENKCDKNNEDDEDDEDDSYQITYLPLMDHKRKLLPVHFLVNNEVGKEEVILHEWMDVCEAENGLLVAQQTVYNKPLLVAQIIEEWLNYYRNLE